MSLSEVTFILSQLRSAGCGFWLAVGWEVDALVGRQTRPHRDLDLASAGSTSRASLWISRYCFIPATINATSMSLTWPTSSP